MQVITKGMKLDGDTFLQLCNSGHFNSDYVDNNSDTVEYMKQQCHSGNTVICEFIQQHYHCVNRSVSSLLESYNSKFADSVADDLIVAVLARVLSVILQ